MRRRLCAILATDVVGYTRLIRENEALTRALLASLRTDVFAPIFADHHGTILNSMGDGWLVEFPSAVDAVNAAMRIQDRMRDDGKLMLRMGLHIGDVTEESGEHFGDGINIAARLEAEAPEGGLLISDAVYSGLDRTLSPSFEGAGTSKLKNIDRDVATWLRATTPNANGHTGTTPKRSFPRLAIIPVQCSDPRADVQDLAVSLTADLQTLFASAPWLHATIDSNPPEGSYVFRPHLRSRSERLRLECRLTNRAGDVIWTHKSDTTREDSFDWQDDITDELAGHGTDIILETEHARLAAIPQEALTAEDHNLLGIMAWRTFSLTSFAEALAHQEKAMALDPTLEDAYADAIVVTIAGRTMTTVSTDLAEYVEKMPVWVAAARALKSDHVSLTYSVALAEFFETKNLPALNRQLEQVIRRTPFDPRLLSFCGWAFLWSGQPQNALDYFEKSLRFGLRGPFTVAACGGAATACIQLGRSDDALPFVERGLRLSDDYPTLFSSKAAALANLDRLEEARETMQRYRQMLPSRTVEGWRQTNDYNKIPGAEYYFEGLRRAGLPER